MNAPPSGLDVAIVGAAVRVPSVRTVAEFWKHLDGGQCQPTALPPDRAALAVVEQELGKAVPGADQAALLSEYDADWRALRIPPMQVERMHRMERVALSVMAEALVDAGIHPGEGPHPHARIVLASSGLGVDMLTDHRRRIRRFDLARPVQRALREEVPEESEDALELIDGLFNLAAPPVEPDSLMTSASMAAGRIATLFDLQGGHFSVDAGLASSLAAVEVAAEVLAHRRARFVLVCGHSPIVSPSWVTAFAARGLLGERPHPEPFGPRAGTVLGEGAVALVLARADDDVFVGGRNVYAQIAGVAGVPVDAEDSQRLSEAVAQAAQDALSAAAVDVEAVVAIESRAVGLGGIEVSERDGLTQTYGGVDDVPSLGASGHRVGYLGPAAGMLALLKAALCLRHGETRPGVHPQHAGMFSTRAQSLGEDAAVGVSDAGLAHAAFHAILRPPRRRPRVCPRRQPEPLAVLSTGVVAPGANSVGEFWHNITRGAVCIGDLPRSRWDVDALIEGGSEVGSLLRTRLAGVVELPSLIPGNAPSPEPSWTLATQAAAEAVQRLGPEAATRLAAGRVDVVVGQLPYRWAEAEHERRILFRGHLQLAEEALLDLGLEQPSIGRVAQAATRYFEQTSTSMWKQALDLSTSSSTAAAVQRALGLRGMSLSVDAACASSLAALEVAWNRIAAGRAEAAVVCGVAFNLLPEYYISLSLLGALSPSGAPPFDVGSDGFVPAEGAGAFVVKPLSVAERQGDPVLAVIRGLGTSSDGAGRSVFAPSMAGQRLSVERALESAGLGPDDIDYVEAHGTGTKLGDATELSTYRAVFADRDALCPLELGTVKSHIGHQSSAAGATGLIKVVSALDERLLPPSNADTSVAAELDSAASPIRFSTVVRHWPRAPFRPRTAGVSAFGLGGINYHAIVTESPVLEVLAERHPGQGRAPPRGTRADRLAVEMAPLSLLGGAPVHPVRGKRVLLLRDGASALATALAEAIAARGGHPLELDVSEDGADLGGSAQALRPDWVIDLSHARDGPDHGGPDMPRLLSRFAASMQVAQGFSAAMADEPTSVWAAVTTLGGDLGLSGAGTPDSLGAAALGLCKGIRQEFGCRAKGIDVFVGADPNTVARWVLDELEDGNTRMEVGYVDRRFVPVFRRRSVDPEHAARARPGVYLFSGGGRGVTFECALALARQGVRVVAFGRSPRPDPSDERLSFDDETFEAWGRRALEQARNQDRSMTPVRFMRDILGPLRSARELRENLLRAESQELPFDYECCDVTDGDAVRGLVERVTALHGPIVGAVHGAMYEHSTALARKTPEGIEATLRTKVEGGLHLIEALAEAPPEVLVFFGSGAGRFGNRGQSDYCAANNAMAALLQSEARRRMPHARAICLDWTAWGEVGAAARDENTAARVADTGVTSITTLEGVYWFLEELGGGETGERLYCEERLMDHWPSMGPEADGTGVRALPYDDAGEPLRRGLWPMVGRVRQGGQGTLRAERILHLRTDPFLQQHTLHGAPILPMAFGVELLAEVAQIAKPELAVTEVRDFSVHAPAKLHRGRPLTLDLTVNLDGPDPSVSSASVLRVGEQVVDPARLHHRARMRFGLRGGDLGPELRRLPRLEGREYANSFFHLARDPVGLGPAFCRAGWICVADREVTGRVRAPRMRDSFSFTSCPRFLFDPFILDASFQIASNWDGYRHGWVSVPVGVAVVRRGRRRRLDEEAWVWARVTELSDDEVVYDITTVGEDDALLVDITALRLRRIAQVARDG